jgi:hypothetical protein
VRILLAFAKDTSAGEEVSYLLFENYFVRHNYSPRKTTTGLRYAQQMGWIRINSFHSITLLEPGFLFLIDLRATSSEHRRRDYIGIAHGVQGSDSNVLHLCGQQRKSVD